MKNITYTLITLVIFSLILLTGEADGCSCVRRETCEYASSADAVFTGKVIDTSEVVKTIKARVQPIGGDWEDEVRKERRQVSRIRVDEYFLGTSEANEILIETDIDSSCAFPLKTGETYIFYANRGDSTENLMTGMCSGTKPVAAADAEVATLRAERGKLTTVSGKVGFGDFFQLDPKNLKKYGVNKIRLVGAASSEEESIGPDGGFRFRGIPAGEYRLEVILPDTLIVDGEYNEEIAGELGIEDQRLFTVSGVGCVIKELPIRENGRISGRLLDDRGQPVPNVEITALPIGTNGKPIKQEEDCSDTDTCVSSKDDGSYLIKGLKSGRYLIGVRLDDYICNDCADSEYKKALYPGVSTEARAKPIVVGFGKHIENIDLKLTAKYREREIVGTVAFKDGKPAANVRVRFVARTPDLKRNGLTFIKTDGNGSFTILAYDDHSYMIGAFTDDRDGNEAAEAKAVVVKIVPTKAVPAVRLVLDQTDADDDYDDFDVKKAPKGN